MQILDRPAAVASWSAARRAEGLRVGLVPTMGALHDGHFALVEAARRHADIVVVSIFVNPMQFERTDDFDCYPRTFDADLEACRIHCVDAVYAPTASVMYPSGFDTAVIPGVLGDVLEGAARPGHFRGVTTVVTKLFNATQPHVAVFGEKDFQQLAVIRRMTHDLDMPIEIVGLPTVRDADGLAMSSRNRRLSPEQRRAAVVVPNMLQAVRDAYRDGTRNAAALHHLGQGVIDAEPLARFERLDLVDTNTLQPVEHVDQHTRLLAAVWFGDVRLIDNCSIID